MRVNNFKELEKEEMKNLDPSINRIKSNVNSNLSVFQFIGELIELFLPKVFKMFIHLSGSRGKDNPANRRDSKYPNT